MKTIKGTAYRIAAALASLAMLAALAGAGKKWK